MTSEISSLTRFAGDLVVGGEGLLLGQDEAQVADEHA